MNHSPVLGLISFGLISSVGFGLGLEGRPRVLDLCWCEDIKDAVCL